MNRRRLIYQTDFNDKGNGYLVYSNQGIRNSYYYYNFANNEWCGLFNWGNVELVYYIT